MSMFKLSPNFEMTMYLAQATGACIVTDSHYRWSEVQIAIRCRLTAATPGLAKISGEMKAAKFAFPQNVADVANHALTNAFGGYADYFRNLFGYLSHLEERGPKPNRESQFSARFPDIHAAAQNAIKRSGMASRDCSISCVLPAGGIQDNTINRLLLMSSSERHLSSVPMAFFIDDHGADKPSIVAQS